MYNFNDDTSIEINSGFQSISYTLETEHLFLLSGYKVLKGQKCSAFARCNKILNNGRICLVYSLENKKPLTALYGFINFEAFLKLMGKVFEAMELVKNNGFLHVENLDLAFNRIYADPRSMEISIIYLPVNIHYSGQDAEMEFRKTVSSFIKSTPLYSGRNAEAVSRLLLDETKTLVEISAFINTLCSIRGNEPEVFEIRKKSDGTRCLAANLRLVSMSQKFSRTLSDHSYEYVIGKSQENADGLVSVSSVSRKHCRIYYIDDEYYIEDLDSTNGTFINNIRIPSYQKKKISNGDVIGIADVLFKVEC